MNKPQVTIIKGGKAKEVKEVKNLGWLLRKHPSEVRHILFLENDGEGYKLTVIGRGWTFRTPFASKEVFLDWVTRRRKWQGKPVYMSEEDTVYELRGSKLIPY